MKEFPDRTAGNGHAPAKDRPCDVRRWGNAPGVLKAMREEELDARVARVTVEVRFGQEVPEILASVRKFEPDLLVMGAKGHYASAASRSATWRAN